MTEHEYVRFSVIGMPGPQGSKRHVGRGVMIESSKKVKPWREAVVRAARAAGGMVSGPVSLSIVFTLPKPKSAPKRRITYPDRKPDLSKLVRSTEDALVTAGAIEDDARIVSMYMRKTFPGEDPESLDVPGAVIIISRFGDAGRAS